MNNEHEGSSADFDYVMSTTLEQMYNGAVRKLAIQKNIVCRDCIGTGLRNGANEQYDKCESCSGDGMETYIDNNQEKRRQCRLCGGHGQAIIMTNRCKQCNGKKFVHDRYILEVDIKRGMFGGQKIVFRGEGHQKLSMEFGDFTITLDEMSHRTFKRNKNDLSMVIKLNLTESLCGFQKTIKTLDNRQLMLKSEVGKVYKTGDTKYLKNEGMPIYKNGMRRGHLLVNFEVCMPDKIPFKHVPRIEKILPQREKLPDIIVAGDGEDCNLLNMDPTDENMEPEETPYHNQQNEFDTNQEFPTHDHDSQDEYGDERDDNQQAHEHEHYHEAQYHQEAPYDEAGRSSPESLESYHPPR